VSEAPWRLVIAGPAGRHIEGLPEKYATAIADLLPAIAANPRRLGRPLKFELEGKWAARRGPYRIIYVLEERSRIVRVLAVGHRADIYRRQ
jgi:mRNA-degrading endonuclease RelE of RelBE toxin-antitoxin system